MRSIAFVVLLLAASAVAQDSVAEGRRFRVTAHFPDRAAARLALRDVEAVWSEASSFFGTKGFGKRLEVHLYRNMSNYAAAERQITGGQFRNSGAFSAYSTRAAYVALQPGCGAGELREFGLPMLTRVQLAHEACHVVSYHATENYRAHPSWYGEGIAMWASIKAIVADEDGPGPEGDPYTARLMRQAAGLHEAGRLPRVRDILRGAIGNLGTCLLYTSDAADECPAV